MHHSADRTSFRRRPRPRVEVLEARTLLAAAGSLDPGFDSGYGYVTLSLGLPASSTQSNAVVGANAVVEETNGKIVVGGSVVEGGNYQIAVARFNVDGSPDTSFGTFGHVQFPLAYGNTVSTAVQTDGKIIEATYGLDPGGNQTYVVARLDLDGSLDTTFGTAGIAEYPVSTTTAANERLGSVAAVVIQADNKIVLLGSSLDTVHSSNSFAAVRLNTDGSLDTTYGVAGTVVDTVSMPSTTVSPNDIPVAASLQSDGKIVLVGNAVVGFVGSGINGTNALDVAAIRLNTDGSVDTAYGSNGSVLLPPDPSNPSTLGFNRVTSASLQPSDGKLLISGTYQLPTTEAFGNTLYRLDTDGTLDPTLGTNGRVTPTSSGAVAALQSGTILVAGTASTGGTSLLGLNPDGTPDATFVSTTVRGLTIGTMATSSRALSIQSTDGKILLAGAGRIAMTGGTMLGFSVARFLPTATTGPGAFPPPLPPPASLDGTGRTNVAIYDPTSASFYYRPQLGSDPAPNDVAVFFGTPVAGQTIPAVADYAGTGTDQIAAYLPATGTYAIRTATGDQLVPFGVSGIAGAAHTIPTPADFDGDGKADIAVYVPVYGAFGIRPSGGGDDEIIPFGTPGVGQSIPAPADYFGTHQADLAVYMEASGSFAIRPTNGSADIIGLFGMPGLGKSIPVPGDYDGSGKVELAVYIPSLGEFIYRPANGGPDVTVPFGTPGVGELPVPGDYDGSGHDEVAVYDPTRGFFAYHPANGGNDVIIPFGPVNNGSIPVAAPSGSLPEFAASGSGSGTGAFRPSVSLPGSSPSVTTSAVVAVKSSSAVPAGPTLASIRVPRSMINQGSPNLESKDH